MLIDLIVGAWDQICRLVFVPGVGLVEFCVTIPPVLDPLPVIETCGRLLF